MTRDAPAVMRDDPAFPTLPAVNPLPNLPEIRERETESDSGGSDITFISEMDVRQRANTIRQEARWIELGLDKAVPRARLQIVTRAPTEKKRNKSIVKKNSSEKRVRMNEPTTKKDNQPVANVPLFDDEWKGKVNNNHPTKGI
jgi:hypothetical protein